MSKHLSMNDYYSEGERVVGIWRGKAAKMLGLEGQSVDQKTFEALRSNRHPGTGEKLRPRSAKVAYHDFVISAPKSVSIAAMTGGDERVIAAYDRCVVRAFERLESNAAIRVRSGHAYHTEELRLTGNAVAAVFRHDTSRMLDPQLHTHMVFANLTRDEGDRRWLALQPKQMGDEAGGSIRQVFYRELAEECRKLGYETETAGEAFRLKAVDRKMEQLLSQRTVQRKSFEKRYAEAFGRAPDKKRIEQFIKEGKSAAVKRFKEEYEVAFGEKPESGTVEAFVRDWRSAKMHTSTATRVRELQQQRLGETRFRELVRAVGNAVECRRQIEHESDGQVLVPRNAESERETMNSPKSAGAEAKEPKSDQLRKEHKQQLTRAETLRRMRRGMAVTRALQGHPAGLLLRQINEMNRRRHHG